MNAKAAINKEIFTPHNEKMLAAVQVKRRTKKKIPFLATGGQGDYMTFICLSVFIILAACSTVSPHSKKVLGSIPRWSGPGPFCVEVACSPCVCVGFLRELRFPLTIQRHAMTVKKPTQVSITKVKQFEGSSAFVRRSQWTLDQLRQVNGIDPNRDCPEFDLTFENGFDQWVAGSAGDKCVFVQVLHNTCQRYSADRKPEFVNCQSKLLGGNSILHSAADSVSSAVQKASQALNERGERLGRAEEKTGDMMNSAQQFADTAHKLAMKHKC
ncbi:syntaxin-binding protein 6 isoform X2 [Trichomycterus rosablanca]|uniref:syntaxin-binding protein 6 isoform X2 n=1 Tax=Trichomycterus rosablanca TaxID=2290929 RepID=UPI002F353D32